MTVQLTWLGEETVLQHRSQVRNHVRYLLIAMDTALILLLQTPLIEQIGLNTLDTTRELCKLIKLSPRRDAIFKKLKQELAPETPGFRTLCPTQWTIRASSLKSVMENYTVLQELWEMASEIVHDSETRARLVGIQAAMKRFDNFGVVLAQKLLQHTTLARLFKTHSCPLRRLNVWLT